MAQMEFRYEWPVSLDIFQIISPRHTGNAAVKIKPPRYCNICENRAVLIYFKSHFIFKHIWVLYRAVEGGSLLEVVFCVCFFRTMMCDNKSAARYVDLGSHSGSGDRDHLRLATLYKVPRGNRIDFGLSLITVFTLKIIRNVA